MSIQVDTTDWTKGKNYPEWMNEISLSMISKGYLMPDEDVFGRIINEFLKQLLVD
jgi:hypothetical protein